MDVNPVEATGAVGYSRSSISVTDGRPKALAVYKMEGGYRAYFVRNPERFLASFEASK